MPLVEEDESSEQSAKSREAAVGKTFHVMMKRPKVIQVKWLESKKPNVAVTRPLSMRDQRWRLEE